MPGRFGLDVAAAWGRHVLRRPRNITPFVIEKGGRMHGHPTAPQGAQIEGGALRLQPGYVLDVRGPKALLREGSAKPVIGTLSCGCAEGPGDCGLTITGNMVVCGGSCKRCSMLVIVSNHLRVTVLSRD